MAVRHVDDDERRARLVHRHRLHPDTNTDDVAAITDDLVALHSSDPVTVYLSATARMRTPSIDAVSAALYDDRTVLRHHAMRRTLWVMTPQVAEHAHHAATVGLVGPQRRLLDTSLREAGVDDPAAWVDDAATQVLELLRGEGPLTARTIGTRLPHLTTPLTPAPGAPQASAHSRLLLNLGFEGRVLRANPTGTWINGQYRWSAADAWSPGWLTTPSGVAPAAAALARRWLWSFGPGTLTDLKWWLGSTVAITKRALADVGAVEVALDGGDTGYLLPDDVDPVPAAAPSAVLLPGLDPSTMGWKQRSWYLSDAANTELFDRNGNGGPAAWVDGRIVGGWVQRRDGRIALRIVDDIDTGQQRALTQQADRIAELLGDVRFTVRFPAPMQSGLLA